MYIYVSLALEVVWVDALSPLRTPQFRSILGVYPTVFLLDAENTFFERISMNLAMKLWSVLD